MKELEILKRNIKIAQDFATYLCLNYPANIHRFNIIQFELVFLCLILLSTSLHIMLS